MTKLVYSHSSGERSRSFALRTDILEHPDGSRLVKKTPLYPEGMAHLDRIAKAGDLLRESYARGGFAGNSRRTEAGGVIFDWLSGETLEERLDSFLKAGDPKGAGTLLREYLDRIRQVLSGAIYQETAAFRQIFGRVSFEEELTCALVTNIDMICQNVIPGEPWVIMDDEWTFDFPVPAAYVLFRIIHYYLETAAFRQVLQRDAVFREYGITEAMEKQFTAMERHFQTYIRGGIPSMQELYLEMGRRSLKIRPEEEQCLRLYYSYGQGYCEEDSRSIPFEGEEIRVQASLPEDCKRLRIDPGEHSCTVRIRHLSFDNGPARLSEARIHGGIRMGSVIHFRKEDPCIYDLPVPEGAKKLRIHLEIRPGKAFS